MSTRWFRASFPVVFWVTGFLIWEGAYRLVGWREFVFPAPSHVVDSLLNLTGVSTNFGGPLEAGWPTDVPPARPTAARWWDRPLVNAVLTSTARLVAGFAISISVGGALGLFAWRFRVVDDVAGPVMLGLQTLPSVCWVPLAILLPWFGLSERGILFVLVMGSFAGIAISLRDGLRQIPPVYHRAGSMLGARRLSMYRHVLLPASLPALSSALRQGFSFAWRSLMGAELIFLAVRHRGIGYQLAMGRETADVAQVVGVLLVMIGFGMAVDRLAFSRLERAVHARFGLDAK